MRPFPAAPLYLGGVGNATPRSCMPLDIDTSTSGCNAYSACRTYSAVRPPAAHTGPVQYLDGAGSRPLQKSARARRRETHRAFCRHGKRARGQHDAGRGPGEDVARVEKVIVFYYYSTAQLNRQDHSYSGKYCVHLRTIVSSPRQRPGG